jgi:hypothetical protein
VTVAARVQAGEQDGGGSIARVEIYLNRRRGTAPARAEHKRFGLARQTVVNARLDSRVAEQDALGDEGSVGPVRVPDMHKLRIG